MMRVIFVDDEPNILSGLKRMLRPMRKQWKMEFFDNGADALSSIRDKKCDVVVSDMRMPVMDGVELLTKVRKRSPASIRIALSGQSDANMIYRCIKNAHQYLAKPCSAEQLVDTVKRACALQEMLSDERVRERVGKIDSIPSLPQSYQKLIDELQREDPSMKKVAGIVEEDVSVSVKVLQIVNSAYFGLPREVSSVHEAVMFLGIDAIKNLILANGIFKQFDRKVVQSLRLEETWSHSLRVGTLARTIAVDMTGDKLVGDYALMGGLLADVGLLILAIDDPEQMKAVMTKACEREEHQVDVEREMLGYSHMEVGAYLAAVWGLPNVIVEAIGYHHDPGRCETDTFTPLAAVYLADALIQKLNNPQNSFLDDAYAEKIGVTQKMESWFEILEVEQPTEEA